MDTGEERLRLSKRHYDHLCPRCASTAVYRAGSYEKGTRKSSKQASQNIEVWRCAICFETFDLI